MSAAAESYPPRCQEEAVGAAEDAGILNRLQLLGTAARLFGHVPTVARAGTKLAGELARVVVGRSDVEAERRDWRFKDPTWTGNPGYHRLMQGYLATCQALGEVAEQADLPDWRQRERARFVVTMLTSTMAPTNTLLGNPAALKEALETGGGSLVAGARNFVSDLRHNGGLPSQVDRPSSWSARTWRSHPARWCTATRSWRCCSTARKPRPCTRSRSSWCRRRSTSSTSWTSHRAGR